ncbi:beta-lactamase/transpeptidase-like protein [Cylindrobasidium torrendii FP15055 ss-10]|uniref:Beta-lactamase/transpeptidase-like protein n=1 Tax=Cylindrobasidium torrendii FP15055 ss-10 TaxID=1314674 RepID=A0A0D7B5E6_9AGAR|nr:beta-lactamase/transpeptidase-like protein [Cylindrobasidium torrendii FP15055 ss-10]
MTSTEVIAAPHPTSLSSHHIMAPTLTAQALKDLDNLLEAYPYEGAPGTVVGINNTEGKLLFLKAVGTCNIDSGESMKADQIFWIASCTKLITGIAAMQLVEQGKLDLEATVSGVLPELAEPDIIAHSTSPFDIHTRKAKTAITFRMLLTHTAGFSYSWYSQGIRHWTLAHQTNEFTAEPLKMPLVHEPGEAFEYGISMDWMGLAIERISGLKLGDYCDKYIFGPLGLKDITFDLPSRPDLLKRLHPMHRYDLSSKKFSVDDHITYTHKSTVHSGGAGIFSSAPDYLAIVAVLLNNGRGSNGAQILKPDTIELMFQPHEGDLVKRRALDSETISTVDSSWDRSGMLLWPGISKGWGYSFLLNLEDIPGGRKAYSAEWGGIANLYWHADRTSGVGSVVFNNIEPYSDPAFFKLQGDVHAILYKPGNLVDA